MVNYNDGKWHGWNGGECPVHYRSEVQVVLNTGLSPRDRITAGDFGWGHDEYCNAKIVAFRVITEHKEPREFWVNMYPGDTAAAHRTKAGADNAATPARLDCIHVREVTE